MFDKCSSPDYGEEPKDLIKNLWRKLWETKTRFYKAMMMKFNKKIVENLYCAFLNIYNSNYPTTIYLGFLSLGVALEFRANQC